LLILLPSIQRHHRPTLFPYTTLFRSKQESVNFIPIDDYDRAIVSELNAEKASWRSNQVSVVRLPSLDAADPLDQALRNYLTCLRSEEHTSELQSRENIVCRLLLEKKN